MTAEDRGTAAAASLLACRYCRAALRVHVGRIPAHCDHCSADDPLPAEVRAELERQIEVRRRSDALAKDLDEALRGAGGSRWLVLVPFWGAAVLGGVTVLYGLYLAVRWFASGSIPLHSSWTVFLLATLVVAAGLLLVLLPVGAYVKQRERQRRLRAFAALAPLAEDQPARCRNCGADLPPADRTAEDDLRSTDQPGGESSNSSVQRPFRQIARVGSPSRQRTRSQIWKRRSPQTRRYSASAASTQPRLPARRWPRQSAGPHLPGRWAVQPQSSSLRHAYCSGSGTSTR